MPKAKKLNRPKRPQVIPPTVEYSYTGSRRVIDANETPAPEPVAEKKKKKYGDDDTMEGSVR